MSAWLIEVQKLRFDPASGSNNVLSKLFLNFGATKIPAA